MRTLIFLITTALGSAQEPASTGNLPARSMGPNDLLALTVYGAPELTRTIRVGADGELRLPMLRQRVTARGLMPAELEGRIAQALIEEDILVGPIVTVTVVEYHGLPISVAGAVRRPVTFRTYGRTTLLEALTRAEGLGPEAGAEILITRPPLKPGDRPRLERIPVKGLIDAADDALNVILEGGEEIRVPQVGRVFVVGNVKRPGAFRVEDGVGMTVLKALALSEGLAPFSTKQAYVFRRDAASNPPREVTVELRKILDRKSPDIDLTANDILYIPDNRVQRATVQAIERAIGFASATASGAIVLGLNR